MRRSGPLLQTSCKRWRAAACTHLQLVLLMHQQHQIAAAAQQQLSALHSLQCRRTTSSSGRRCGCGCLQQGFASHSSSRIERRLQGVSRPASRLRGLSRGLLMVVGLWCRRVQRTPCLGVRFHTRTAMWRDVCVSLMLAVLCGSHLVCCLGRSAICSALALASLVKTVSALCDCLNSVRCCFLFFVTTVQFRTALVSSRFCYFLPWCRACWRLCLCVCVLSAGSVGVCAAHTHGYAALLAQCAQLAI